MLFCLLFDKERGRIVKEYPFDFITNDLMSFQMLSEFPSRTFEKRPVLIEFVGFARPRPEFTPRLSPIF
jgi:hypothetical protein